MAEVNQVKKIVIHLNKIFLRSNSYGYPFTKNSHLGCERLMLSVWIMKGTEWFEQVMSPIRENSIQLFQLLLQYLCHLFIPLEVKPKLIKTHLHPFFFSYSESATYDCCEFWLVHCIVWVFCGFPEWLQLLWFWFYNIQLETALNKFKLIIHVYKILLRWFSFKTESFLAKFWVFWRYFLAA